MRILYVTTIGKTMTFFKSFISDLTEDGHIVDIAANEYNSPVPDFYHELGCNVYNVDFSRSPLSSGNFKALKQLKKIVEDGNYDIVHCHTPVASAFTRLACKKFRKKTGLKVFYTAHGFHFYKGASKKNWLIYYPIEWLCSFWTDTLITITTEDYKRAEKHFHAKRNEYVPGVGIDIEKFGNPGVDKTAKRKELGVPDDAILFLSVGELNENKNHALVLRALSKLRDINYRYIIAGAGSRDSYLQSLAEELGISNRFKLLGRRNDVPELLAAADVYLLPSIREGLNVSVMEAMSAGLPVILNNIRGNNDLITDGKGGALCPLNDEKSWTEAMERYALSKVLREESGDYNKNYVKRFDKDEVSATMLKIYYGQ